MLQDVFIMILIAFILALPLVFWMYIFISFFSASLSRWQFLMGVGVGGIITGLFVFSQNFFFGDMLGYIFSHILFLHSFASFFGVFGSFIVLYTVFVTFILSVSLFFSQEKKIQTRFIFLIFFGVFLLLFFCLGILYFLQFFQNIFDGGSVNITFQSTIFQGIIAIISYYIAISFLEEVSKNTAILSFGRKKETYIFSQYIVAAASIALGFSFFENLYYAYQIIQNEGLYGNVVSTVFFRSIFSVVLHIVSSLLLALGFWKLFSGVKYGKKIFSIFLLFALSAIVSHSIFNISLTYGYVGVIFFYAIGIYILLSSIIPSSNL